MGGSVPKAQAQVTGLHGHQLQLQNPQQQPNAGPGIDMQDEYQSALSIEEVQHIMPCVLGYEPPIDPALRVAAVRHHVPQGHEMPFETGNRLEFNALGREVAPPGPHETSSR